MSSLTWLELKRLSFHDLLFHCTNTNHRLFFQIHKITVKLLTRCWIIIINSEEYVPVHYANEECEKRNRQKGEPIMHCTFNKVGNALRFNKRVKRPLRLWLLMTPRPTIRENEINSPRFSSLYLSLFLHLLIPRGRQAKSLFDSAKKTIIKAK